MTIETKDLTKAEIKFLSDKCEKLEKQLEIAVELLEDISNNSTEGGIQWRCRAIGFIKKAREKLAKIKELDK